MSCGVLVKPRREAVPRAVQVPRRRRLAMRRRRGGGRERLANRVLQSSSPKGPLRRVQYHVPLCRMTGRKWNPSQPRQRSSRQSLPTKIPGRSSNLPPRQQEGTGGRTGTQMRNPSQSPKISQVLPQGYRPLLLSRRWPRPAWRPLRGRSFLPGLQRRRCQRPTQPRHLHLCGRSRLQRQRSQKQVSRRQPSDRRSLLRL